MDTLGIVESKSIAAGIQLADAMMKAADVELVRAAPICSGRYLIFVSGNRAAVGASVDAAVNYGHRLMGSFVISNLSPEVAAVLKKNVPLEHVQAVGVVECRSVSSGVAAADAAVKRSGIELARFAAGQGINGKSYFVMSGDVAAVQEAADAASAVLGKNLVEAVVIPGPDASVVKALVRGTR
ncbi:BMC domain-containing protein [Maridesulfovibrio sp.]|uniref:BMC domain-containing protein n=1 Tax=Maridesulfovibrio sp. TaxID=2795000 RepID=UPI002A1882A5|nr:BMC domain-containing protein [Maridesulfovibrio sp.]